MSTTLQAELEQALGTRPLSLTPLSGGSIGSVYRVQLPGRDVVAKYDPQPAAQLDVEGSMLRYLRAASALPVPDVLSCTPHLLIMSYIEGSSRFSAAAQQHAAELLAALHTISGPAFGHERATLIGGLHQPNHPHPAWLTFFRDQRLLYMTQQASERGTLPAAVRRRLERCAGRLDQWLDEPAAPALIHGDVWTTNVLAQGARITGFVDPALYYADAEIELAFTTLFGTFGDPFFERYAELRPLSPNFFSERRDIYNLYPLLVHVTLFGSGYVAPIERTLRRFGC
jgi:fructosamine-3-kinase